jgi:uncharacterized protein YrrD
VRKGRDLIGKPIVAYDSGKKIDNIRDLIFDQNDSSLLGFLVQEGSWFSDPKILPLSLVRSLGNDAAIVSSKDAIAPARDYPNIHNILEHNNILNGTRIMTTDGRDLGKLVDFYFNEYTGAIEGYETSGGLFADAYSGRSFVPAFQTLKIGEDVAFVPAETVALMEEQVGGLKAAMQSASEKIQQTAQVAGERIQETAQIAGTRLQEGAQVAGTRIQDAGRLASTRVTDAVVDRSAQKAFVIGKVAQQPVANPHGGFLVLAGEVITDSKADAADRLEVLDELYRSVGGNLRVPLSERIGTVVAGLTVEQAQGRRVRQAVYTPEGYIIAAQGQIVTPQAIERAKANHREAALLEAVGLSSNDAAQSQAGSLVTTSGNRLKTTTSAAGERLQADATNLWDKLKESATDFQGRSTRAIEEKRIKGALGRPTTRVILDRNDGVILNVGELISHKAIDSARAAGVLDVLLDSVYVETPHLSLDELRAPGAGSAAL